MLKMVSFFKGKEARYNWQTLYGKNLYMIILYKRRNQFWSGAATNLAYDRKRIYGAFADCIKAPEAHNEAQHRPW